MQATEKKLQHAFTALAKQWDTDIIPQLESYIKIPCKSPLFDPHWKQHGYIAQAMQQVMDWCKRQPIHGLQLKLFELDNLTPVLLIEIPGQSDDTVLLYGHIDKQPEMTGWKEGSGPWIPIQQDGKLYGRGGADDGYAVFAAISAIATLQQEKISHARCVILIEASEESGSCDLSHHLKNLTATIGTPSLIIALDSECANYQQLWSSTSLRGIIGGELHIEVIKSGLHSGYSGGIVPSTFAVLRQVLNRIENPATGEILIPECHVKIPPQRIEQAHAAAKIIGNDVYESMDFIGATKPLNNDITELLLNRSWRPALAITGANGFPSIENAGNVTLPSISIKLSLRLPPPCDPKHASAALKRTLEQDPPFNAHVRYTPDADGRGWDAPPLSDWLAHANTRASELFFGRPAGYLGIGGTIPFMAILGEMYPKAEFLITGVLGPHSNAHGPNEFLHIDMVKKVTACVATVIAYHFVK